MTSYAFAFAASFCYICLKALQQIQVVRDHTRWIMPTSIAMATCEFYLVGYMVTLGPSVASVVTVGVGAGLGCLTAMKIKRRK